MEKNCAFQKVDKMGFFFTKNDSPHLDEKYVLACLSVESLFNEPQYSVLRHQSEM